MTKMMSLLMMTLTTLIMMTMSLSLLRSSTRIGWTALWSLPPGSSPNTRSGLPPDNYQSLYSIDVVDRRLGSKWACQPAIINCKWNWWSDNDEVCDPTLFTFLNLATFSPSSWSWPSDRVITRTHKSAEKGPPLIFWRFSKLYFCLKGGALFPYRVSNEVWAWKREASLCSKPLVQNLSLAPPSFLSLSSALSSLYLVLISVMYYFNHWRRMHWRVFPPLPKVCQPWRSQNSVILSKQKLA